MGKKGPLGMVTPDEFRVRTALTLSKRSGTTLKVDEAYDEYFRWRTDDNAAKLHQVLREYVAAHGGYWARCERDKVSGGLLEWVFKFTAPKPVAHVPTEAEMRSPEYVDRRAAKLIEEYEIPHSRFGVLYLLGNIDIELNWLNVGLEGVSAIGGAIGSGFATDMNKIGVKDSSYLTGMNVFGKDITAQNLVTGGALVVKVGPKAAGKVAGTLSGHRAEARVNAALNTTIASDAPINRHTARPAVVKPPTESFPTTVSAVMTAAGGIYDAYEHGRYYGHAATAAAIVASPVVLAGALLADVARKVWQTIRDAVVSFRDMVLDKLVYKIGMSGHGATIATVAKAVGMLLVEKLMAEAAPLVGAVKDLAGGLARTFTAVKTRLSSYLDRKKIRIVAGHPEEIANSIEDCMNQGIFMGLLDLLKGAAKAAIQATLPGLGSLVSAIMTGLEWLIKFIVRLVENYSIKKFLEIARGHYELEKQRAKRVDMAVQDLGGGTMARTKGAKEGSRLEPNLEPGGLITDTAKFTEFFKFGCEASPLIPMLTLNTGICGSLMTLARMFDDTGAMIKAAKHGDKKKEQFDVAGRFFTRLKQYGGTYLKASGFKFRARDPNDLYIQGLLDHAVQHHQGKWTVGGAVTTFLTAA
jgi:hypothetical protein